MPWAPDRRCLWLGCTVRQRAPYCRTHVALTSRNHSGVARQRRGLGPEFERAKRLVIQRDAGRCQLRLRGCTAIATSADHVIPRSWGGSGHPTNLRASCGHCNSARGDGQADMHGTRSAVPGVTTGRGIESLAGERPARTAWQPRSRAAETHGTRWVDRGTRSRDGAQIQGRVSATTASAWQQWQTLAVTRGALAMQWVRSAHDRLRGWNRAHDSRGRDWLPPSSGGGHAGRLPRVPPVAIRLSPPHRHGGCGDS